MNFLVAGFLVKTSTYSWQRFGKMISPFFHVATHDS
jgi:hypothetical protein